ncbi:olfactory receptor 10A2-like [Crotalus tigris]|uniref:olfactory receptor 10A2-like n=1 Tax=Crotalus tigris TaxID=88082 RepID=UPI00192F769B|nr:olfactory receptor 10A2-like [Crotalus tigris]XP_039177280.1 olfactory receptor 10A2-like [Crotalus tigris]XP_039177281.1 olfactory receptor 10A2-like [Crotalus tigris]
MTVKSNPAGENQTIPMMFILLDFNIGEFQPLFSIFFLLIYLITMTGNILIVLLVIVNQKLHTPMYFFLGNLSFLETCYSCTIMPRIVVRFLSGDNTIYIRGCFTQLYFFGYLATTECYFLAVMSYDRYLAICKPLHYAMLMNSKTCILLITGSWISGSLFISFIIYLVSKLSFCGPNKINHFFCDLIPLIRLSCDDVTLVEITAFIISFIGTLVPFIITLTSYVYIIKNILRIPSIKGKQKAFSTCSSHLTVVGCFYGSLIIVYVLPNLNSLNNPKKLFSLFYTLLTPLVNPIVYSLRNNEVKGAMKKIFTIIPKGH